MSITLQVDAEVEFMLQHNLANSDDGWIMDPSNFGTVSLLGGFYPLDSLVNNASLGKYMGDANLAHLSLYLP